MFNFTGRHVDSVVAGYVGNSLSLVNKFMMDRSFFFTELFFRRCSFLVVFSIRLRNGNLFTHVHAVLHDMWLFLYFKYAAVMLSAYQGCEAATEIKSEASIPKMLNVLNVHILFPF